jgi:predicted dehydrogenase/nucleoside-diphosphate-sugar epimerase
MVVYLHQQSKFAPLTCEVQCSGQVKVIGKQTRMRYLILGGGSVTTEYYLPALRLMGRFADVTVVDPDARSIKLGQPLFGDVEFSDLDYVSFLKALEQPKEGERNCVIIALPNQFHVDAVRLALERERHVLCEKPLALKALDCSQLRALAAEKQCLLKVGMSRRYLPSLMLARDIVTAEELGEVRSIDVHDCQPFLWRPRSFAYFSREAGGILAETGVHYLDYLDMLVGPMEPVAYSDDAKGGTESSLRYSLAAGDVRIDMRLSRIQQSGAYIKITCERGEIRVDKVNENEVIVTPRASSSRRISAERPFDDTAWPCDFHGSFCQMLADFARAIEGRATRIADATDAERTVALIEWAYEQRRRGMPTVPKRFAQSSDRTKVLVTGGTGFIGGHLVERLSPEADDIRVTARTPAKCANISRFPVEIVPTDLLDMNSVRLAVAGARIVYHLAYGNDGKDPGRITIDGTKNIVNAAIEAGAECVVVLSTMYVFGFPQNGGRVDESFPYRPYGGEYGRSKAAIERWCLARAQSSFPTRIVILNPTCVFGPGGGSYTSLPVDLARQGQFCWISDGAGLCNYNYVENLIDAMVAATQVPEAHGSRFIINDGAISWREFLGPFIGSVARHVPSYAPGELVRLSRYGGPFRFRDLVAAALSAPEVRAVAKRSATVRKMFELSSRFKTRALISLDPPAAGIARDRKLGSPVPPEWLASLYGPARAEFSAGKANLILKWRPRVELASAQAATLQWLVESGRLPASTTRARE